MEVQTNMPFGEFELMAPLLGEHCFESYNYDFTSCFSSNCYSGNWPQEDRHSGLDWEGYCNIDTAEINGEIIDPKPTKRKCETESNLSSFTEASKKRPRISITNEREEDEGMSNKNNHHGSGSCLPENDSTDKSGAPESPGKYTKHCLYARKRREKISQKLKTLQKLIPNGTKVDISTMLEEAYQYVKFLQLQIKLLSSEEHWMYAPIALNGINDAQNHNISQAQQ